MVSFIFYLASGYLTKFHRFSVTNNGLLSEFNWKAMNLKGVNKRPFKCRKICQAVQDKFERSMVYQLDVLRCSNKVQVELITLSNCPHGAALENFNQS